jgi:hypothetical protein
MIRPGPGVTSIVNEPAAATFRDRMMIAACLIGLACAATAGVAGLFAVAWNGVTLIVVLAARKAAPRIGVMALGIAAIYGLAALATISGTDPEDVDRGASSGRGAHLDLDLGLAVVAFGCAVVGITSALVWAARRRSRL